MRTTAPVSVGRAIPAVLRDHGARVVFGLMGDGNLRWVPLLNREGVEFVSTRHESAAVGMADGYARTSGEVGVATVTEGPGLTNSITALRSAAKSRTPLVLICGEAPTGPTREGQLQYVDQPSLVEATGSGLELVRDANLALRQVRSALDRATFEARPIVVSIPTPLQDQECRLLRTTRVAVPDVRPPSSQALRSLVRLIEASQRPVILCGRGAARSGANVALAELSDRIGALLTTSVPAKDLFLGHPHYVGISGGFASEPAARLLGAADLVLAFGSGLNEWTLGHGMLYDERAIWVQVDHDPHRLGLLHDIELGILADVRATAEALNKCLDEHRVRIIGYGEVGEVSTASRHPVKGQPDSSHGVDPTHLLARLNELLPHERTVSIDDGHFCGYPAQYLDVPDPSGFCFAAEFGAVGLSLATAMGASIGQPNRLAVAVMGDGGFMMSLTDLDTAVRHRIPVVIVVMNDGAFTAEVHILAHFNLPDDGARYKNPALADVSRALGGRGLTVRRLEDLEELTSLLDGLSGPLVVDCHIDSSVPAKWMVDYLSVHQKS